MENEKENNLIQGETQINNEFVLNNIKPQSIQPTAEANATTVENNNPI